MVESQSRLLDKWKVDESLPKNLIFFDACRHDFFKEMYDDYYGGELTKTYTPATWTQEWFEINFDGKYHNIAYYDPADLPRKDESDDGYIAKNHFDKCVQCRRPHWDREKQLPKEERMVKDIIKDGWDGKRIIRIMKPHGPWINSPITNISRNPNNLKELYEWGRLTQEEMYEFYRKNLKLAFEKTKFLAQGLMDIDEGIIITSDHGDYLGEKDDSFLHGPKYPKGIINRVPWFEIDKILF